MSLDALALRAQAPRAGHPAGAPPPRSPLVPGPPALPREVPVGGRPGDRPSWQPAGPFFTDPHEAYARALETRRQTDLWLELVGAPQKRAYCKFRISWPRPGFRVDLPSDRWSLDDLDALGTSNGDLVREGKTHVEHYELFSPAREDDVLLVLGHLLTDRGEPPVVRAEDAHRKDRNSRPRPERQARRDARRGFTPGQPGPVGLPPGP